jgi:hypothetical protein
VSFQIEETAFAREPTPNCREEESLLLVAEVESVVYGTKGETFFEAEGLVRFI